MPDTLIVLIGPTGVGKTELSLSIAEHFRTSIVSADSRQLYADLKIGTAAPTPEQLARVPHYFVGTLQLTDYYSAAQYEADVLAQLEILYQNHDTVILTGGSMMYIDAICKGIDDIPTVDNETRQLMLHRYEQKGLDTLCAELKLLDPEYYKIVDLKNPKRVIHALEICYMTGKTYTSFRTRTHKERPFRIIKIGLTRDREELYDRINRRVDIMMQDGLLEEARHGQGVPVRKGCSQVFRIAEVPLAVQTNGQGHFRAGLVGKMGMEGQTVLLENFRVGQKCRCDRII